MGGCRLVCAFIGLAAHFFMLTPMGLSASQRETRWVEASAHNASSLGSGKNEAVDRRQINIEPQYDYVSHSVLIISANPDKSDKGLWSCSDGVVKGEDGRVQSVWVEVRTRKKGIFGDPVHVRARLLVIVEERGDASEKAETLPAPPLSGPETF